MAEIHVPKDAQYIVIELINLAQQVESDNDYTMDYEFLDSEETRRFSRNLESLVRALHLLPYKWCKVDPFEYRCRIVKSRVIDFWILSFCPLYHKLSEETKEFAVPKQIFDFTQAFGEVSDIAEVGPLVTEMRMDLSKLRDIIAIRSKIETQTASLGNESIVDQNKLFKISPDNRTAYLDGEEYILNEKEGAVIRYLYEMSQEGFPNVEKQVLIDIGCGEQSSVTEVRLIFSDRNTYRALVRHVEKGMYRLNI